MTCGASWASELHTLWNITANSDKWDITPTSSRYPRVYRIETETLRENLLGFVLKGVSNSIPVLSTATQTVFGKLFGGFNPLENTSKWDHQPMRQGEKYKY